MIRAIFTGDVVIRDSLNSLLSLEKKPDETPNCVVYQRADWILIYSDGGQVMDFLDTILEYFAPDRLYIPILGRSIDVVHEIGDVILPNVFLTYDAHIGKVEITEENRDNFLGKAHFLELYNEQKDYYVEDFGLSVGGIIVDNAPSHMSDMEDKLMLAYEADVYVSHDLKEVYNAATTEEIPTIITAGIIEGKQPKNLHGSPIDHTMRNMITTWRLLEDDEENS